MIRIVPFLLLIFSTFSISAQRIQVLEKGTNVPIDNVLVFNKDKTKTGITDFDGFVDISSFSKKEIVIFQHLSHIQLEILKSEILATDNKVSMLFSESTLGEVVVSVSKFQQAKKDIPQKIASLSAAEIAFANPQTSADLLNFTGNVYIQKSQSGGGSPNIRGFSTNRLLITVDGMRFNSAIFRSGNIQNVISIDPFSIANTEVVLGPGSVVYGSDAIGGVMNFYTKQAKFSSDIPMSFSGNATMRYATANQEKTGNISFNIGLEKWAFLSNFTYSDFDDLKMGKHGPKDYLRHEYVQSQNGEDNMVPNKKPLVQKPSGYKQINAMQKIRYMPSENWDFNLGLFYTTTGDFDRYDRLIRKKGDNLRAAEWYYGPQEWIAGNFQASHKGTGIYDQAVLGLSYQRFSESRHDRDFGKPLLFETEELVNAYSGTWDFEKKITSGKIFYGLEYVYNKVNSEGSNTNVKSGESKEDASRYPDNATWQSMAAYSSLHYNLLDNLSLQGGLRYNYFIVKAVFDSPFYQLPFEDADIKTGSFTGSAGLTWQPSKILGWRTNFGTAFRAPNIDDIGKVFDSEPGSVVVPNPNLKPEYSYTGEVGATINFNDIVKIDLAVYLTHLKDAMVRRDFDFDGEIYIDYQGETSRVQAIQNAAKAEIYGLEAGVEVNFTSKLQFTAKYNINDGFEEGDNGVHYPIRSAAPQFGNAHLIWKNKILKFDVYTEYNSQFDYQDLAPSQAKNSYLYALDANGNPYSPSWYTLNLAVQYKISTSLQLHAALENITDQRYRPYSSGISAPGRNLIVAATYTF